MEKILILMEPLIKYDINQSNDKYQNEVLRINTYVALNMRDGYPEESIDKNSKLFRDRKADMEYQKRYYYNY